MSTLILELIGLLCMCMCNDVTNFDSFGVEHIPEEIKAIIDRQSNIKTNIFKIKAYDSIMCGYFCIGYIVQIFFHQMTLKKMMI